LKFTVHLHQRGLQTLGVVRAIADPDNIDAEFAIIVRSDLKGRGLGHLLLSKMIDYLAGRGTRRIVGYVLRENTGMHKLVRTHGFVLDESASDPDALHFVRVL